MTDRSDPFHYGRRQRIIQNETAQPSYESIPLTPDDFLNPELDDEFVHGSLHHETVTRLYQLLTYHHRYSPFLTILRDVKLVWESPELAQPMPDITIVQSLDEPERPRRILDVAKEGAMPTCIIEVTSPRFAQFDKVQKLALYEQAGVLEYFVVEPSTTSRSASDTTDDSQLVYCSLYGFRLAGGRYQPIEPDAEYGLYSDVNRVWLATTDDNTMIQVIHGRTREPIQPPGKDQGSAAKTRSEANIRAQSIADQLGFLKSGTENE